MHNQFFNENYLRLSKQAEQELKNALEIIQFFVGKFEAENEILKEKQNNMSCQLLENNKEQEMTITKRTDGRYQKTITINKNRIYIYGKTQQELIDKYRKIKQNHKKKIKKSLTNRLKVIDWFEEWYNTFKEKFVSIETAKEIKNILFKKLEFFHNIYLNKLDTTTIQNYFNKIPKSRPKEKIILYFKASLEKAQELGKIKTNPFNAFIKEKKIKNIRPPFTYDEQLKIMNYIQNNEIKVPILIYLITGLRKDELNYLNIEQDIDSTNNTLTAKNLKQHEDEPPTKIIDLSEEGKNFILNNSEILKKFNKEKVYRQFKNILNELNIKGGIHTLRHTFATNHIYFGTPIKLISTWLGHSTTQITQDIYIKNDRTNNKEKLHKLYNNLYYQI